MIAGGGVLARQQSLLLVAIFSVFAAFGHYPDGQVFWLPLLMA